MPKDERRGPLIARAASRLERIIHSYPTRFPDIEAAKQYVLQESAKAGFTYTALSAGCSSQEQDYIKDKVHFIVAIKAFEAGEFYVDVAVEDKRALRASIESDISRLPPHFHAANCARDFVAEKAGVLRFSYTAFEGVEKGVYEGYVDYNTARHAFEAGVFTMKYPGYGWKEKLDTKTVVGKRVSSAGKSTMTTDDKEKEVKIGAPLKVVHAAKRVAIQADVHRLLPFIPSFPPSFPDLNAAHDHIAFHLREQHSAYTYWAGEDPRKFRLFVNFAAAKWALGEGRFRVWEGEGGDGMRKNKKEEEEEEEEESVLHTAACAEVCCDPAQKTKMARSGAGAGIKEANASTQPSTSSSHSDTSAAASFSAYFSSASSATTPSTTISSTPPFLIDIDTSDTDNLPAPLNSEFGPISSPPLLMAPQDPFRDLLAELEKVRVLDIAFG